MWKKSKENLQKRQFPAYFRYFRPEKKNLSKIGLGHVMSIANMHLCAKNRKKLMMKSREMAKKPVFPAYSARKIRFSKIGLRHILGIAILHLCAKNQQKLMSQSPENVKKPGFPAYFQYFQPEKIFSRKLGSVTFWGLPFCIFVPKIRKN